MCIRDSIYLFLSLISILIIGCFNSEDSSGQEVKELIINEQNLEEHYLI